MSKKSFFFAGGGTGGHIYPALAIAERLIDLETDARIHFFCSNRPIDSQILSKTNFEYTKLPAAGFAAQPSAIIKFGRSFLKSYSVAKKVLAETGQAVVIGLGGFVSAPVCFAAHRLNIPVAILNTDFIAGRANKLLSHWADEIFVQFEETAQYFAGRKAKVHIVGCPLRKGFENPQPEKAVRQLGLDKNKKILLVTGASSGSATINDAVCLLLEKLNSFSDTWQIVHLAGAGDYQKVKESYDAAQISHKVLDYWDDMPNLLASADLVIGRSGAVSVAEYAASGAASICMPYPHHKDRQQYLNADKLVEAGAAIIVDDLPDSAERGQWLWEELELLLKDDNKREEMEKNCEAIANTKAASKIAERLLKIVVSE
jgi:UDP-N-acetylglucosamine--N-acetylmuramyl-(pentapeptide) pyrophosphoryl-undecaprenol N-acetylglucosamine transferase